MQEKIENALNEGRILVLVAQVLLGFQFQSLFQPGFVSLPALSRSVHLGGMACLLLVLGLLVSPVPYHHYRARGALTGRCHAFISRVTTPALFPFALALGANFYVVSAKVFSPPVGAAFAGGAFLVALYFWYGLEVRRVKEKDAPARGPGEAEGGPTPLKDRIRFVLTEARVVLPGAQAFLGFQFAAVLTSGFDGLSPQTKATHFASLAAIAVATILLMSPPAYHRIVEQGENTERLYAFSARMVLWAMAFLAVGIAGSVYVAVDKVFGNGVGAVTASVLTLFAFLGAWFGMALLHTSPAVPDGEQSPSAAQSFRHP